MSGPETLGSTWRPMMYHHGVPIVRETCTYGSTDTDSAEARATLAKIGVYTTPMASIVVRIPGPMIATMARASSSTGKANMTSTSRMSTVSSRPRT